MVQRYRHLALLLILGLFAPAVVAEEGPGESADPKLAGLEWRCIGPARGGRVSCVAGVVGDRRTYYMGACGGGVWKTTNAGGAWKNVSDTYFKTGSVGAIAVAESDPNVIYVGMGEPDPRGNFSHGDGVYKSTDAGKTWKHVGLSDTRQIGRIAIDPKDPNRAYVAALGHIYGPNKERGVFRTTDGGATWHGVKQIDAKTGAVDICIDPHNPRVLYAGFWQVSRKPWRFDSGGPGSGLWRSQDGGDSWTHLTKGLPKGVKGKIGVSASAARKDLVYAIIEAETGGVFRSTDGGDSWKRVNEERKLRQRAWYYSRIHADPQQADTVYVLNVQFHKSVDGGKSFRKIDVPHVDNHGLWIDPRDNQRMVEGNDGGANVSFDGGETWSRQDNQPTAQFYRVTTDNSFPYRVLGAQQDNSTVSIAHTTTPRRWRWGNYHHAVGGGESGYIASRPDDPNIVYAGSYAGWITRYDHRTRMRRPIAPWPENPIGGGVGVLKHRFQWTFPIVISPHDPNVLYIGGEVVFRSTTGGESWDVISPDLTTNDKAKQASSGGPITQDNTTVEYHCTIFSIAESPKQKGRIWVGTDDGRVHVTDDASTGWDEVTPKGLAEDALVSLIDASPHDPDTAWLAVNRYKSDDFKPYVYRTRDRGKTWDLVVKGIAGNTFVRSIREDPVRKDLLFAGTETGVWYSMDGGASWSSLQRNLPVVPVTDVAVKDDDLVIATQGRSFWILGGLNRLRRWDRGMPVGPDLMKPSEANRALPGSARIHFHMPETFEGDATLSFIDDRNRVMRTYRIERKTDDDAKDDGAADDDAEKAEGAETKKGGKRKKKGRKKPSIKAAPGMNLFAWDLQRQLPTRVPGAVGWPPLRAGPRVLPGTYRVVLQLGDAKAEKTLVVRRDPRLAISDEDLADAAAHADDVYDTLDRVHKAVNTIRGLRAQVRGTKQRARKAGLWKKIRAQAEAIEKPIRAIEDALIQSKSKSPQDPLNYPVRLNDKLTMLLGQNDGDPRPTQGQRDVLASLKERVQVQLDALDKVLGEQVPAFNKAVAEASVPAIVLEKDE